MTQETAQTQSSTWYLRRVPSAPGRCLIDTVKLSHNNVLGLRIRYQDQDR